MSNNKNNFFDTSHLKTDLKKRSLRSGAVTLTSQGLSFVINIGSTMILARLLTPQDYGMISMVATITGFAHIFSELGLSSATIQQADINHQQVSTLFWINVGLGVLITLIVAAFSPAVAWFYKNPELVLVTAAVSLNFLIRGLAVQHLALLTRQMQFLTIAKVQMLSTLLGIAAAVFMAMHGYRYWALVFNTLTSSASCTLGYWLTSKWRPGLPQRKSGVRTMLRFGSNIAGFSIINYFSRNLDNMLIGRYYGSATLGLYSKAYQLLMLPITNLRDPLNKVAMPALSRLQYEPEQYRSYYMKFIAVLAFVTMPIIVFMYVCSDNLIRVVLGQQWLEAGEIFKILAIAGLIQPVWSTLGVVFLSTGRSKEYFVWGVGVAVMSITSFLVGIQWGAKGVATAYAIANYLMFYPSLVYALNGTSISIKDFFFVIYRPFFASIVMGASCFSVQYMFNYGDILNITIYFLISLIIYIVANLSFAQGRDDVKEYLSYVRLILLKN